MSKRIIALAPELEPERRQPKLLPIASIFVLAPLVAPLFVEAVGLCHAQWCEILGRSTPVRTPMLDSIGEEIDSVREDLWNALTARFQRVPWNPKVVLPLATVIMAIAMMMLRL